MHKKEKIPFVVKNEINGSTRVLTLSGNIQKRYWSDDAVIDAKLLSDELEGVTDDVVIKLNSPGGDVFQGIEIYNYLKDHPSNITIENTGLIGSAATFMLASADKVVFNVGTTMMIHEASTFAWGNKTDIQKTLNALGTIDESILSIYSSKTGQTTEQLESWMLEEKWFTADEAVEYGFADEVKREVTENQAVDIAALVKETVAVAMAELNPVENQKHELPIEEPKQKSLLNKLRKGETK